MDPFELASYAVIAMLLGLPALLRVPMVRAAAVRAGTWALERLTPEPEVDQDAIDLYEALRRERLLRDVARLRRVVANDEHMSAVRQIGNRMAYDRLVHDLAELRDAGPAGLALDHAPGWSPYATAPSLGAPRVPQDLRYRPKVETLELGRRR